MSDKVRLAVIGTGMAWDRLHLPAIRELSDKYEVVALANPTMKKLIEAADKIGLSHENIYQDYHQMLKRDDIDAVNVVVPISMNYVVSKDVADAGKNFICEKPLAPNLEQAIEFVKLQNDHDVKIMIAENFRYNEENNIIKKIIEEKKIGDVLYFIKNKIYDFEVAMKGDDFAAKEWRQHPEFEGGMFLDGGVHDIAGLRYIFGSLDSVSAFGREEENEYSPYTNINCNLLFDSGVVGHYVYCCNGKEAQQPSLGLRIFGTKGMIYLEDPSCGIINVFYNDGGHEMINYTPDRGFYYEFLNFYNALKNGSTVQVTPRVEFGDMKTIFSLLRAAKNKETVKMNDSFSFITEFSTKVRGILKQ